MFPRKKKFKVMPTTVKIMATVLKEEGGVLIWNFLPTGIIVNTKTNFKIGNSNSMNSSQEKIHELLLLLQGTGPHTYQHINRAINNGLWRPNYD